MANDRIANPAPLGFAAFGITAFLLSSSNAGLWHGLGGVALVGTALFYGGIVELLVAVIEFIRGDSLGATVFASFGAFWLSAWYWMSNPELRAQQGSLGVFLLPWAATAFVIWIAAMKRSVHHNLFFFILTVSLIFLTYGNWAGGHSGAVKTGGWLGLIASVIAVYIAAKVLINEAFEKELLP